MDMPYQAPRISAATTLKDKVAVITGSTSGIGLGIARAFAAAGANVVINGIAQPDEIERIHAEWGQFDRRAIYDDANLMDPDEATGLVTRTAERFGKVDIIVNNAGIQFVSPVEDFPQDKWDAIIALNLSAAFHTIRTAFPMMKAQGFGRIINVASAHGLVASPFKSAYVAAKHGIIGLTKTVALEGARHGITCNAICPGYVWTPLVEKQIGDTAKARGISYKEVIEDVLLAAQPSKSFATVDELGALAVFLASNHGRSMTGASLSMDGGWTAQ